MGIVQDIRVRFAGTRELKACEEIDHSDADIIRRKAQVKEIIVAELDGEVVGYLRLEYLWSTIPYIGLVRVRPEYQRRGIGRALLGFLEAFLRDNGYQRVLSSSQADDPAAQAWHRATGFEECGILSGINEAGVGEVFFRKALANE